MMNNSTSTKRAGPFSAPRKFDLSTVLVVTTAYAAAFAMMRAIGLTPIAILTVGAFFTSVALGQAILFRGKNPRWASAVVGACFFAFMFLMDRHGRPPHELPLIVFNLLFGALWGYAGGVIVGAVFMIAHGVRLAFFRRNSCAKLSDE